MENLNSWNLIYSLIDPVAISIGSFELRWYGIMYAIALLSAYFFAKWLVKKDKIPISQDDIDVYFIWVEVGVILGARMGYVLFYDPHTEYYLTHPWQIFNPFLDGVFVGISGLSYHGAFVGFILATYIFVKIKKIKFWLLMDVATLAVPLGYIFGRIGNFLNERILGRETDVPWGVISGGDILRHPATLYESFLEGVVVFTILYFYRSKKRFDGEIASLYAILYGIARFIGEFYRQPDIQLGFVCCGWMTMGQLLSMGIILFATSMYWYLQRNRFKTDKFI